jgi:hypothetical protein
LLTYPFNETINLINVSLISPPNNYETFNQTQEFTFNVTGIVGTWNTSLILNDTSYGSYNLINTTGVYSINASTIPYDSYLWRIKSINSTDINGTELSNSRTIHVLDPSITRCQNITTPNIVFKMNNSVYIESATCFDIQANNVTIDCQGYSILGNNETADNNEGIKSVYNDTSIFNCIINDFHTPISFYDRVSNPQAPIWNVHVENTSVTTIYETSVNTGIELRSVHNVYFKNVYSKCIPDDAFFIVGNTTNLTFDNITGISGEYAMSFYGDVTLPRVYHTDTLINNSYLQGGDRVLNAAGIGFEGIHDYSDNINTTIINTVINQTGVAKPCLRTTSGSTGTIFLNNTCIGAQWIANPETDTVFNDSFSGNRWYLDNGSAGSTINNWIDINNDTWADIGTLPVNETNNAGYWNGNGGDYHPFTLTLQFVYDVYGTIFYNGTVFPDANVTLVYENNLTTIVSTTTNSSGDYFFNGTDNFLFGDTYYLIFANNRVGASTNSAIDYIFVNDSELEKNLDFFNTSGGGGGTTVYPSCYVFKPGCYAYTTLTSNNCAVVGQ